MTFNFNNVYVKECYTIAGIYEKKGIFGKYYDKTFDDLYYGQKSWEKAEIKLLEDSVSLLLNKSGIRNKDIDLIFAGDLMNQITTSCFGVNKFNIPFIGLYSACATNAEGIILASNMIENKNIRNAIISTASHNMSSEKQFRNPTEYGSPKPKTATFTATGGASILLTNSKTNIKVSEGTIGKIIDLKQNNPLFLGSVMVPAAADTLYRHLTNLNKKPNDYDLILTGDLGIYGKKIMIEYMKNEHDLDISNNYDDCGSMIYDLDKQKECLSGGSGPVCNALVNYSYIYKLMKDRKLKKVLFIPTGALFSPNSVFQHQNILGIAHAFCLEVC